MERISDERLKDLWWFLDTHAKQDAVRTDSFSDCRDAVSELQQARSDLARAEARIRELEQALEQARTEIERLNRVIQEQP